MTDNITEGCRLLLQYTSDGDIMRLAGSQHIETRRKIYNVFMEKKMPLAKSGVNAIQNFLLVASGVTGGCWASQKSSLLGWIQEQA